MRLFAIQSVLCTNLFLLTTLCCSTPLLAQFNSMGPSQQMRRNIVVGQTPEYLHESSHIRGKEITPRTIEEGDIVRVRVDEISRMTSEGEFEGRRTKSINTIISDWIRFNGFTKAEKTQADGVDPQIKASDKQLNRAEGSRESSQSLTFEVAVRVLEVRGQQVLVGGESRVHLGDEVWVESVRGWCNQADIGVDFVVLSSKIADLKIEHKQEGYTPDAYKRGWAQVWTDRLWPF